MGAIAPGGKYREFPAPAAASGRSQTSSRSDWSCADASNVRLGSRKGEQRITIFRQRAHGRYDARWNGERWVNEIGTWAVNVRSSAAGDRDIAASRGPAIRAAAGDQTEDLAGHGRPEGTLRRHPGPQPRHRGEDGLCTRSCGGKEDGRRPDQQCGRRVGPQGWPRRVERTRSRDRKVSRHGFRYQRAHCPKNCAQRGSARLDRRFPAVEGRRDPVLNVPRLKSENAYSQSLWGSISLDILRRLQREEMLVSPAGRSAGAGQDPGVPQCRGLSICGGSTASTWSLGRRRCRSTPNLESPEWAPEWSSSASWHPPPRERPADVPGLVRHFLDRFAAED